MKPRSTKLKNGSRLVGLKVNAEAWAWAESTWRDGGYTGPEDYLNAVLNMAMLQEQDLAAQEAAQGKAFVPGPSGDLDDDIPF